MVDLHTQKTWFLAFCSDVMASMLKVSFRSKVADKMPALTSAFQACRKEDNKGKQDLPPPF